MFCSKCGQAISEGTAFCKNCGSPAPDVGVAAVEPMLSHEDSQEAPPPLSPSTADAAVTTPPPPPPAETVPLTSPTPPVPPPPVPPPRQSRTGLIIGIVAALVVVLAGAGIGIFFLLRDGDVGPTTTTTLAGASTTVTTSGQTDTTVEDTTTQTVPETSTTSTTGSSQSLRDYLGATDALVQQLLDDDERIPELATQINDTAPKIPQAVYDEFQAMMGKLDAALTSLGEFMVPAGFEESNGWLEEAAMMMGDRIQATMQGIEAVWDANSVAAGAKYFDLGRQARDDYRAAFQQFQTLVPID